MSQILIAPLFCQLHKKNYKYAEQRHGRSCCYCKSKEEQGTTMATDATDGQIPTGACG